ncbi:MAG TPA: hypothetical protein VHL58_07980 [Thermoanaerobaculia bacterium]|nr:hypothetical protein [Thermoanaerobaculia bacterium]
MIRYLETIPLRVEHSDAPQFPFWQATLIAPYSARRAEPISIDYKALMGVPGRAEASYTRDVVDQLERQKKLAPPWLIDATEAAEKLYSRGASALDFARVSQFETLLLLSTDGSIPSSPPPSLAPASSSIALCAWPVDEQVLESHSRKLQAGEFRWGMVVPIFFPLTTDLAMLERLADLAVRYGAEFLAAVPIDIDPQAKSSLAETIHDDDAYQTLFHSDLEAVTIATERHVADLAKARRLFDHVRLPHASEKSNWNAAVLLALAGTRLLRMRRAAELGWDLLRSSRIVAQLRKPLERIAEAASLSIIEGLDEVAVRSLEAWVRGGEPAELDAIDAEWRLRRDQAE